LLSHYYQNNDGSTEKAGTTRESRIDRYHSTDAAPGARYAMVAHNAAAHFFITNGNA
jgi:hypothetical protein